MNPWYLVSLQLAAYRSLPMKETLPSSLLPSALCFLGVQSQEAREWYHMIPFCLIFEGG